DVLACDHVVFTQAALAEFVARTSGGELVTVDKPAAKPARAAKPKAAAEDGDEPAAGESGEPAAKPARAARTKATAGESGGPADTPGGGAGARGAGGGCGGPRAKAGGAGGAKGGAGGAGRPRRKARQGRPQPGAQDRHGRCHGARWRRGRRCGTAGR